MTENVLSRQDFRKSELANYTSLRMSLLSWTAMTAHYRGYFRNTRLLRDVLLLYDPLRCGMTIRSERKKHKEGDWRGYGAKTNLRLTGKCSLRNANALTG